MQQAPFRNLWTRVELPKVSQQTHTRHPALPAQECADRQGAQSQIPYPPQAVGPGLLPGLDHDHHLHVKNGVAAVCGAVLPGHGQPLAEDCRLRVCDRDGVKLTVKILAEGLIFAPSARLRSMSGAGCLLLQCQHGVDGLDAAKNKHHANHHANCQELLTACEDCTR